MPHGLFENVCQQELALSGVNVIMKRRVASGLSNKAVIDCGKIRTRDGMRMADCNTRGGRCLTRVTQGLS